MLGSQFCKPFKHDASSSKHGTPKWKRWVEGKETIPSSTSTATINFRGRGWCFGNPRAGGNPRVLDKVESSMRRRHCCCSCWERWRAAGNDRVSSPTEQPRKYSPLAIEFVWNWKGEAVSGETFDTINPLQKVSRPSMSITKEGLFLPPKKKHELCLFIMPILHIAMPFLLQLFSSMIPQQKSQIYADKQMSVI